MSPRIKIHVIVKFMKTLKSKVYYSPIAIFYTTDKNTNYIIGRAP